MTTPRRLRGARLAAVLAALALLVAACGSDDDASADAAPSDDAAEDSGARLVEHALGETEVPSEPEVVVPLGGIYVADLIRLGIVPAALGDDDAFQMEPYAELLPDDLDLDSLPTFGDPYDPNLEALAGVRPDLIVGDEYNETFYEQLSGIAPTVLVTYINNGGWRERFPDIAEAVGREDEVAAIDAEYQAVIDEVPASLSDQVVAFVRSDPDGAFRVDSLPTAFPGSVAEDAGIPTLQPDSGEFDEGSGFATLSGEQMEVLADADIIVLGDNSFYDPELQDTLSQLEQNPLWASLPAVQQDRVVQIPGPIYNGGNYYAATLLLRALSELG